MQRWLVVSVGIAIAAAAFYLLGAGGAGPEGIIDDASRARLDHVLREADAERGPAR